MVKAKTQQAIQVILLTSVLAALSKWMAGTGDGVSGRDCVPDERPCWSVGQTVFRAVTLRRSPRWSLLWPCRTSSVHRQLLRGRRVPG